MPLLLPNSLINLKILNLKNLFFTKAECTGNSTRSSIQEAGKAHLNSFIEYQTINNRNTICVDININNGFFL